MSINEAAPKGRRRAVNKERRISALLSAAERLIQASGTTDFTMQQLAEAAGLSLATTYNLIGTKAAVLYALLNVDLDALSSHQDKLRDAMSSVQPSDMARLAVGFFSAKPDYYRPLMRYLLGVFEPKQRPLFMARAIEFWRKAIGLDELDESWPLTDIRKEDIAQSMHLSFIGALDLWVHHEIDNDRFEYLILRQTALLGV